MFNNAILCATRFNDITYNENIKYKNLKKFCGCIYGTPVKISNKIQDNNILFIIEMNISKCGKNILGIGLINNTLNKNISCNIYKNKKYNKYIYYSNYRIDRNELSDNELFLIKQLELVLFKGKSHIQRSIGITKIPLKNIQNLTNIYSKKIIMHNILIEQLTSIFIKKYNNNIKL
tara:strand:+ start:1448 stop:1975 length:528 start_codon:yes stop_codon:yes gene_type:complete